ncbi:serine/arginine repetitive matrix protein 2 isoform X2 [Anabas testudineus]|nr:serine/arginine repetitive matrix protein 2 isoform X2 [Anabas testudineus]
MGSITMPDPQERMPMPHPHALACGQGFSVRSQSLHSVGGGNSGGGGEEEVGSPTSRKQPPPKPRRDPATKLSMSSEAVDHSPMSTCRGDRCDATQGCSEDCRRVPPPKPKRNPNTQLSVSFDESYIKSHGGSGVCPSKPLHHVTSPCERNPSSPQSDESPTDDCEDEPVYIEMGGIDVGGREPLKSEDEEQGESVYEEMKYPALDDMEYRTDPVGCRSACPTPAPYDPEPLSRCSTPRNIPLCDIPAPFPNLLTHRPPLLVFPPAPAQCSPNSDESPLTPLDVTKLPMLENQSYSKSPTSSSEPSSAPIRRELTATPTLTVSGRSSAPPLPCTLYKSSSSSSYQRSHSACPSPVSMGRCLTPLSLMRTPPFDAPMPFPGGLPRSASATPHGKGSPPQDGVGRLHGSMQNVSTGRSRTPTSPLDELTNLFTTGRNMLKKNASGRKSKEPGETESKSKSHSESKREGKERHSHSKESKRDSKERHSKESSHRRDRDRDKDKDKGNSKVEQLPHRCSSKDRSTIEAPLVRRDSRDHGCSSVEPIPVRRDSKDRGCSSLEHMPLIRRDSKDRGVSNADLMPRRDSKDRTESLLRQDSKDRERLLDQPPELLPRQDSKERARNGVDSRCESRERLLDQQSELLHRQDSKERVRNGTDSKYESRDRPPELLPRQERKDRARNGAEYKLDCKDHHPDLLPRQDSKERARNDMEHRHEGRIDQPPEILPRQETSRSSNIKDKSGYNSDSKHEGRDRICHNGGDLPSPTLPRQDSKDLSRTGLEVRRDSKDRSLNGSQQHHFDLKNTKSPSAMEYRCDSKDRVYRSDGTPRRDNRANYSMDHSKAQERNGSTMSGQHSSTTTPTHHGRSSASPPITMGTGNEMKALPKYGRSPSMPTNPSPMGTPQRRASETHQSQMPQMPWICGDTTMLEQIERKRTLCMEIRSRQHPHLQRFLERPPPPDRSEDRHQERNQCKQESAPVLPGWGKSGGAKKIRPPPYPTQTTVFWDTAI